MRKGTLYEQLIRLKNKRKNDEEILAEIMDEIYFVSVKVKNGKRKKFHKMKRSSKTAKQHLKNKKQK